MHFDVIDGAWAVIEPLLALRVRGPVRVDGRKILYGMLGRCTAAKLFRHRFSLI